MRSILTIVLLLAGALPAQTNNWLPVGGGCLGACGGYPVLDTEGVPAVLGGPIDFDVYPLARGTPVMLYGGALLPTPLDLSAFFGAPCMLITDASAGVIASAVAVVPISWSYEARMGIGVPNNQALVGLTVAFQAIALDSCTPSGVVLSDGAAATLQ